jgi:hypothetical protein
MHTHVIFKDALTVLYETVDCGPDIHYPGNHNWPITSSMLRRCETRNAILQELTDGYRIIPMPEYVFPKEMVQTVIEDGYCT